nr:unnamed protein product [Digitaria exilis]
MAGRLDKALRRCLPEAERWISASPSTTTNNFPSPKPRLISRRAHAPDGGGERAIALRARLPWRERALRVPPGLT